MAHRFSRSYPWTRVPVTLLVLAAVLTACGGQQPTVNPVNAMSITRTDGSATLARPSTGNESDLPESLLLAPDDHLYTASDQTVTLQFSDGSTLEMGPDSHLVLLTIGATDRVAIFRLLAGSVTGTLRSHAFEVQAYQEAAQNFSMVVTDLAVVPRSGVGLYHLKFDGDRLQVIINSGEFDIRSGNQQATLPQGWQASAEPGKPLQIVSLITPTPAAGAASATPIQIISITPTNTPTETPQATKTATRTATYTPTPTPTRTRVRRTLVPNTLTPTIIIDTPLPPTEKPDQPPKPTNPPPTDPPPPPPTDPPPPPPTDPPRPTIPG